MEPQRLIGQAMHTDDHCGRYVGLLEQPAPLRDSLTVAGEDDCFGPVRRNIHRDLPSTVVVEHLGDKLSRHCLGGLVGRSIGLTQLATDVIACLLPHGVAFICRTMVKSQPMLLARSDESPGTSSRTRQPGLARTPSCHRVRERETDEGMLDLS